MKEKKEGTARTKHKNTDFEKGYACALAAITTVHGEMTEVKNSLECCFDLSDIGSLKRAGVDKFDIRVLSVYFKTNTNAK